MAFSAYFAISALVYINIADYGFRNALTSITWGLVVSAIFYLIFIHPKVIFFDEGLIIINPLQSYTIGWHEVQEIDARFTMYVIHSGTGEKIHAFAAQAPGRYHSRNIHPNEIKGMRVSDSGVIRAGESPRSNSGAATAIARTRLEQFQRTAAHDGLSFTAKFNRKAVEIFSLLLIVAIFAQVLHP